jgi:hypothetical protein
MIALVAILVAAQTPPPAAGASSCLPATTAPGVGTVDPFRPPAPAATQLNAEGKTFYRQGKWDDARAKYRAAEAADAEFLAPRLNIACSFVRQERFAEATAEVKTLLARAYIPWAREVLEAADLGALKVHAVMPQIRAAMTEAAAAWGAGLDDAVLFVGRARAPLRIPDGDGVFILNPHQEVYAFIPETGRFRQLTAEDGRVLAFARSKDRRRIMYATADKLVRGPGTSVVLRGVSLHELTLATMTSAPPISIEGDVRRLEMTGSGAVAIEGDRVAGVYARGGDKGGALVPRRESVRGGAVLTPAGASAAKAGVPSMTAQGQRDGASRPGCRIVATESQTPGRPRTIVVSAPGRPPRRIGDGFGAGLAGLPIP